MPVIHLGAVPEIAHLGRDADQLVMKKAIGSRARDSRFAGSVASESISVTHVRLFSRHRRIRCDESDRVMFVVDGEVIVQIGDEPAALLNPGDLALIPRGTPYEFAGDCTYIVINSPAFREGSDVDCEERRR